MLLQRLLQSVSVQEMGLNLPASCGFMLVAGLTARLAAARDRSWWRLCSVEVKQVSQQTLPLLAIIWLTQHDARKLFVMIQVGSMYQGFL
jgi:hypothetical protein